jgi:hypothetical protein
MHFFFSFAAEIFPFGWMESGRVLSNESARRQKLPVMTPPPLKKLEQI